VSKVVAPLIIADAPARALIQNIQNFNGKFGCNICELSMKKCKTIKGKRNKSTYPFIEEVARLRQGRRMKKQA
ncbi:GSCOCG00010525001-RA-CDS, partial [Cotesia congregata]